MSGSGTGTLAAAGAYYVPRPRGAPLLAQLPGPINLRLVLSDTKFADILHDLVTAKGNRSGVPRVLAVDRNETRELAGTLHIEGASKDDAIAQIRAINHLVTVGGTTLTLKSTGATNSVTLNILPSRGVSQPLDELFELDGGPVLASCAFSFTCEPYAYGPTVTIFDATITAPCIVDLGTVPGDYPAPLNMQFNTNSTGFHAIYCGLRRPGSADDIATNYLHEGEGMTWTGGSTGTSAKATAHYGLVRYNNSLSYAAGVTPDDVSPGTYMILARLYVDGAGNSGYVKVPIVGQFAYPNIDALDLYELGCAHLPAQRILGGAGSSHSIMMASGIAGGGNVVVLDYEAFVPTSWGYFRWHPLAATATDPVPRNAFAGKLNVNADGSVYVGDIANLADFRGAPISCVGPSQLVVFAEDHQQAQGCMLNFSATVTPRYALWA